jgi:hypothetical protein
MIGVWLRCSCIAPLYYALPRVSGQELWKSSVARRAPPVPAVVSQLDFNAIGGERKTY